MSASSVTEDSVQVEAFASEQSHSEASSSTDEDDDEIAILGVRQADESDDESCSGVSESSSDDEVVFGVRMKVDEPPSELSSQFDHGHSFKTRGIALAVDAAVRLAHKKRLSVVSGVVSEQVLANFRKLKEMIVGRKPHSTKPALNGRPWHRCLWACVRKQVIDGGFETALMAQVGGYTRAESSKLQEICDDLKSSSMLFMNLFSDDSEPANSDEVELACYTSIYNILAITKCAEMRNTNNYPGVCTADQLLWYRLFPMDVMSVSVDTFCDAMILYIRVLHGTTSHILPPPEHRSKFMRALVDVTLVNGMDRIHFDHWMQFMSRFGPTELCYKKARDCVLPSGQPVGFFCMGDRSAGLSYLQSSDRTFVIRLSQANLVLTHLKDSKELHYKIINYGIEGYELGEASGNMRSSLGEIMEFLSIYMPSCSDPLEIELSKQKAYTRWDVAGIDEEPNHVLSELDTYLSRMFSNEDRLSKKRSGFDDLEVIAMLSSEALLAHFKGRSVVELKHNWHKLTREILIRCVTTDKQEENIEDRIESVYLLMCFAEEKSKHKKVWTKFMTLVIDSFWACLKHLSDKGTAEERINVVESRLLRVFEVVEAIFWRIIKDDARNSFPFKNAVGSFYIKAVRCAIQNMFWKLVDSLIVQQAIGMEDEYNPFVPHLRHMIMREGKTPLTGAWLVDFKQTKRQSLLHVLAEGQNDLDRAFEGMVHEMVRVLCSKLQRVQPFIDMKDANGSTAVLLAAKTRNLKVFQAILKHDADLNITDDCNRSVLHYAVLHWESSELSNYLCIPKISGRSLERQRVRPLDPHEQKSARLIDVNTEDSDGRTPLSCLLALSQSRSHQIEVAEYLFTHGSNADMLLVDDIEILRALMLDLVAELSLGQLYGLLEHIVLVGDMRSAKIILNLQDTKFKRAGYLPMSFRHENGRESHILLELCKYTAYGGPSIRSVEMAKLLLERADNQSEDTPTSTPAEAMIDINALDERHNSALLYAVQARNPVVAASLMSNILTFQNASVRNNQVDSNGWNALHHACNLSHHEAVEHMINSKVNLDVGVSRGSFQDSISDRQVVRNDTALHIAARQGDWRCVVALLDGGADVDQLNVHSTALTCALQQRTRLRHKSQALKLEGQNSDVNEKLKLHSQKMNNFDIIIENLLKYGANVELATQFHDVDKVLDWRTTFLAIHSQFTSFDSGQADDFATTVQQTNHASMATIASRKERLFQEKINQIVINHTYGVIVRKSHRRQFGGYVLYLLLLTLVVNFSTISPKSYSNFFYHSVVHTVCEDEYEVNNAFMDINKVDDFWDYCNNVFADYFYPDIRAHHYQGSQLITRPGQVMLEQTYIVGAIQLRQIRSQTKRCYGGTSFLGLASNESTCFTSVSEHEDRSDYGPKSCIVAKCPFVWKSDDDGTIPGQVESYSEGGYSMNLPPNDEPNAQDNVKRLFSDLQQVSWIDGKTRAVFLEFNLYNANHNLFLFGYLLVEFPTTGGVVKSYNLDVQTLTLAPIGVLLNVLLVLVMIFRTLNFLAVFKKQKCAYIDNAYRFFTVLILILFWVWFVVAIYTLNITKNLDMSSKKHYISMMPVARLQTIETSCLAIIVMLSWFNILPHLSAYDMFSKLTVMIEMTLAEAWSFVFMIIVFLIGFGSATYVSFGYTQSNVRTMWEQVLSRTNDMFNGVDVMDEMGQRLTLGLSAYMKVFISVLFMFLIILLMMNLLIAIMTSGYEQARENIGASYEAKKQYKMIIRSISSQHGLWVPRCLRECLNKMEASCAKGYNFLKSCIPRNSGLQVDVRFHPAFTKGLQTGSDPVHVHVGSFLRDTLDHVGSLNYNTFSDPETGQPSEYKSASL